MLCRAEIGSIMRFCDAEDAKKSMSKSLLIRAGAAAYSELRKHGFSPGRIGTIAGASGGAKWLVLSQLDRVLVAELLPQLEGPVHLVGSSIGAWRFACYAQADPLAAIERFEHAYLEQRYSDNPDQQEITQVSAEILAAVLRGAGTREILANPKLHCHFLAVRSRRLLATDTRHYLTPALFLAAGLNLISRKTLGAFFQRAIFHDARVLPPFAEQQDFPAITAALTESNLADVVLASGSIPLVLNGVRDIAGAPPGTYRDGGVLDYHLDLELSDDDRLTLFPHFFSYLVPGWFDKSLGWRRVQSKHTSRTILIAPSPEFVARLPNGKIPDRKDFLEMEAPERRKCWSATVAACRELADELANVLAKDQLPSHVEPL